MSLRQDYLLHKKKTVESFGFVKVDVNNLSTAIDSIRNSISGIGFKVASIGDDIEALKSSVEKIITHQGQQNVVIEKITTELKLQRDIIHSQEIKAGQHVDIANRMKASFNSFETRLKGLQDGNETLTKNIYELKKGLKSAEESILSNEIKDVSSLRKINLQLKSIRKITTKTKNAPSQIKKSESEIKKLKTALSKKLSIVKKAGKELESKLKSQRKRSTQLNKKIESKVRPAKTAKTTIIKVKGSRARPKIQSVKTVSVKKLTVKSLKSKKPRKSVKSTRITNSKITIKKSKPKKSMKAKKSSEKTSKSVSKIKTKTVKTVKTAKVKKPSKAKNSMNLDKMVLTSHKETTTPSTKTVVHVKEEVRK